MEKYQSLPTYRKTFIKKSAISAAGFYIISSHVISGLGHTPPSDRLNIAGVGVGGKGRPNLNAIKSENIVALCDVDWKFSKGCFEDFPRAKKYWDWREMMEEMGDDIDAVMVATADHTHATVAAHALTQQFTNIGPQDRLR
jgi:hypothetical protein